MDILKGVANTVVGLCVFACHPIRAMECLATHPRDSMAYVGNTIRDKTTPYKDTRLFDVDRMELHQDSDDFDPRSNFIGVMVYYIDGHKSFQCSNGREINTGCVYIKRTNALVNLSGSTWHARCMRSLIGDQLDSVQVSAAGFAYHNGKWKRNSSTYNEGFFFDISRKIGLAQQVDSQNMCRALGHYEQLALTCLIKDFYMRGSKPAWRKVDHYLILPPNSFEGESDVDANIPKVTVEECREELRGRFGNARGTSGQFDYQREMWKPI